MLSFCPSHNKTNRPAVGEAHYFSTYCGTLQCIVLNVGTWEIKKNTVCKEKAAIVKCCFHFFVLFLIKCFWTRDTSQSSTTSLFRERTTGGANLLGIGVVWHLLSPSGMLTKYLFLIGCSVPSFLAHQWKDDPPPTSSHDTNLCRPFEAQMSSSPFPPILLLVLTRTGLNDSPFILFWNTQGPDSTLACLILLHQQSVEHFQKFCPFFSLWASIQGASKL